jgi:hypothetical protein
LVEVCEKAAKKLGELKQSGHEEGWSDVLRVLGEKLERVWQRWRID